MATFGNHWSVTAFLFGANALGVVIWLLLEFETFPATTRRRNCDRLHFLNKKAELMGPNDVVDYIYWWNPSACRIRHDFGGLVQDNFDRLYMDGQKTLCMDRRIIPQEPCLVYSFGINNEWSFEERVERLGCQVYAFDPSMGQEDHDRSPRIHFYNIGIGAENTDHHPLLGWRMKSLDSVYEMLRSIHGQVPIDILKMDVESSEWAVIPQMLKSNIVDRIKQLSVEVHFRNGIRFLEIFHMWIRILKSLEGYGMVRFANRANVVAAGDLLGRPSYICFEMSWYNSKFTDGM